LTSYVAAVDPTATAAGDTAWLLASAALVLVMAPGLAIYSRTTRHPVSIWPSAPRQRTT
jgi:hypothetical protein